MGEPVAGAVGVPRPEPDGEARTVGESGTRDDVVDSASAPESDESLDLSSETADVGADGEGAPSSAEAAGSQALYEVTAALHSVEVQVQAFHVRAENYEQVIRQMQSRIEQLQGDQVQALLKPVIQRFAGLHAQATEASEKARDRGEAGEKDFSFFAVAIEEALGLVDIESVAAAPSVEFDSRRHHASRIVPTADPELDNRVQRVLRQGFTYADAPRVFLPAQVSVYRYEPPQADDETSESDPTSVSGEGEPGE
ncbi:Molecular chaperone GrpE (Heat shock protein) [metagenome]|uniref:Molecular chaperone GrpE (Heat shock protein) n=1 Tax=metagenome TaxID=256318 RepID=A0A2P2C7S9_9ZZZZ